MGPLSFIQSLSQGMAQLSQILLVYLYIFTATPNLFLPILNIFMHISTYFHVYLYLFSCIFLLISTYLPQKCGIFATDCHKSVLFYYRLPQKCGILLQFDTKVWARNVPQNEVQTNYVPHVPQMRY